MEAKYITNHFINGQFVPNKQNKTFDVINPATQELLAKVQHAQKEDIDYAVKCARQAFEKGPWSKMDPTDRAKYMFKLADLIQKNAQQLATIQSINNGKPFGIALAADLSMTHKTIRYYAGWADKIRGHTINMDGPFFAYTRKQPVGVVAQVIPWNFPLVMLAWKWGPALAAGCTIVMKTAQQTPLSALKLAQLVNQAGFPPGVINIISGQGDTGAYLVRHPGVDKVAFTGSTQVGYDIMKNSHVDNLKRVTLELGGKSAIIVTPNANIDIGVCQSHFGLFFNAGQCCIASSRVYVHQSLYDKFVEKMIPLVQNIKSGDPMAQETQQGPLVSKQQMDRVLSYIEHGKNQGAKLLVGGKRYGEKGWFVEPTLFTDVQDSMKIAKQQIFGPVLCVFKYKDNDQVIERANKSRYGLGAGVVTENITELHYFIERLKGGTVYGNCWNILSQLAPFGGFKDSGLGRQLGQQGLNAYLQTKTVIVKK